MKTRKHFVLLIFFGMIINFTGLSQETVKQQPLTIVDYPESIIKPLTKKELAQIKEVYGAAAEAEILDKPQRLRDVKYILRARIEIVDAGKKDLSGLKKLSEVPLFNDYVTNLKREFPFHPENFNPLKYQFNFYSRNSDIYHVDNTSYYVVIKSQHQ